MNSGDTKTEALLNILGNGGSYAGISGCCNTKTQNYIINAIDRIESVEEEVEELKNNPDVVDIVATYTDLQNYDTQHLTDKDVIRVLTDSTHSDESTYYRYNKQSDSFTYIGTSKQYSNFVGTDGAEDGVAGLVPAPATTDAGKFLKADGTWDTAGGGSYTAGDGIDISAQDVISATNTGKARVLTTDDYNYPANNPDGVALWLLPVGLYYRTSSNVKVYFDKTGYYPNAVRYNFYIVYEHKTPYVEIILLTNTLSSTNDTGHGRMLSLNENNGTSLADITFAPGVADSLTNTSSTVALSANQGRVLNEKIDSIAVKNAGVPTTATVGVLGQLYTDTTDMHTYQLGSIDTTDPSNPVYNWIQRW